MEYYLRYSEFIDNRKQILNDIEHLEKLLAIKTNEKTRLLQKTGIKQKVRLAQVNYDLNRIIQELNYTKRKLKNYDKLNKMADNYMIGKKTICENERNRLRLMYT